MSIRALTAEEVSLVAGAAWEDINWKVKFSVFEFSGTLSDVIDAYQTAVFQTTNLIEWTADQFSQMSDSIGSSDVWQAYLLGQGACYP